MASLPPSSFLKVLRSLGFRGCIWNRPAVGYPADRGHSWSKNSGSVSSSCKRKGQHLEGEKKKKSRHQLVEMVPEFIITERKARFFCFCFNCFHWQLSMDDSGWSRFGDWNPGRCECECVCLCVCVFSLRLFSSIGYYKIIEHSSLCCVVCLSRSCIIYLFSLLSRYTYCLPALNNLSQLKSSLTHRISFGLCNKTHEVAQ